jgi:hypothetical protein
MLLALNIKRNGSFYAFTLGIEKLSIRPGISQNRLGKEKRMESPLESPEKPKHAITRRAFLGTTAVGVAAMASRISADTNFPWAEATIPALQAEMPMRRLQQNYGTRGR